jgi:hypothetical protein
MLPSSMPAASSVPTAASSRSRLSAYGFTPEAITARSASAMPRFVVM